MLCISGLNVKTQRGFRKGNDLYLATARCHKEGMSKCVCERKKKVWRRMCFVSVETCDLVWFVWYVC